MSKQPLKADPQADLIAATVATHAESWRARQSADATLKACRPAMLRILDANGSADYTFADGRTVTFKTVTVSQAAVKADPADAKDLGIKPKVLAGVIGFDPAKVRVAHDAGLLTDSQYAAILAYEPTTQIRGNYEK